MTNHRIPQDFRPAPPGNDIVYTFDGTKGRDVDVSRFPLEGWVLVDFGWLPAYWDDGELRWIDPTNSIAQDVGHRETHLEPRDIQHADTALLEHHAHALAPLADAIGRHNSALGDHADALSRHGRGR